MSSPLQTKLSSTELNVSSIDAVLEKTYQLVQKNYLQHLGNMNVADIEAADQVHLGGDVRLFKLQRLVSESRELMLENAMNTYLALGARGYKVFFVIDSDGKTSELFIGVSSGSEAFGGAQAGNLLTESFNGHFPGSKLDQIDLERTEELLNLDHHFKFSKNKAVTALSGVSSLSLEEKDQFVQGMERFLDASSGRVFTALILAEPVLFSSLERMKFAYESMSSDLSVYQKTSLSYGLNESDAVSRSIADSLSVSLGTSVTKTLAHGTSNSKSETRSEGHTNSTNISKSDNLFKKVGKVIGGGEKRSHTESVTESKSWGTTEGSTYTESHGDTSSQNITTGQTKTDGQTTTYGKSFQQTIEAENKSVVNLLEKIDRQIERVEKAMAYGGWDVAAYFVAEYTETTEALSSMFLGLTRGEGSHLEPYAMTTWNKSMLKERDAVLAWLRELHHPRFYQSDSTSYFDVPFFTPAVFASGQEMSLQLSLPRRSTSGVTVIDAPSFGRGVQTLELNKQVVSDSQQIHLGVVRHLWRDDSQSIFLDVNRLNYHSLITGTTGVGKTTTIKSLLSQIHRFSIPFMVIEPAKGEYVELLGLATETNPVRHFIAGRNKGAALKLNPFVFPDGVALTDHIDRITTVFNAAFSMYGPMPQLLEEAIFAAYEVLGWDTYSSKCVASCKRYPTVLDVLDQIPRVVKELGYSEQVVGDFVGALMARLKSLTRGSLGMTLICKPEDETSYQKLFTESCVVDLSSMGSPEKRAIVMGLLFMRLYEYRLAEGLPEFESLRHLMVLEEAHVLLKKTNTDQAQESSNTTGMAVEAFANALAEMRAYGQGFMVADQSASAIDDSVLRNTNTKIVMRAPYEPDRLALGGALALDEEQTKSLAKLENHTAIVFQSNWLEPVLCRINRVDIPKVIEKKLEVNQTCSVINEHKGALLMCLWQTRLSDPLLYGGIFSYIDLTKTIEELGGTNDDLAIIENFIGSAKKFPNDFVKLKPVVFSLILEPILGASQMTLRGLSNRLLAQLLELNIDLSPDKLSVISSDLVRLHRPNNAKEIAELIIL